MRTLFINKVAATVANKMWIHEERLPIIDLVETFSIRTASMELGASFGSSGVPRSASIIG